MKINKLTTICIACLILLISALNSYAEPKTEDLAKKYASEYIQAREEFYYQVYAYNWEKVRVMSKPKVFSLWKKIYYYNPDSMVNRYNIKIKKIIKIDSLKLEYNEITDEYFIEAEITSKEYSTEGNIKEYKQKIDMLAYFDKTWKLDYKELIFNPEKFVVSAYNSKNQ